MVQPCWSAQQCSSRLLKPYAKNCGAFPACTDPSPQELLHSTGLGGSAANVYWFDAGNNTFWAPKETLIGIRWGTRGLSEQAPCRRL